MSSSGIGCSPPRAPDGVVVFEGTYLANERGKPVPFSQIWDVRGSQLRLSPLAMNWFSITSTAAEVSNSSPAISTLSSKTELKFIQIEYSFSSRHVETDDRRMFDLPSPCTCRLSLQRRNRCSRTESTEKRFQCPSRRHHQEICRLRG
jgi:hypothetical protein